jgi:hypothetical protein
MANIPCNAASQRCEGFFFLNTDHVVEGRLVIREDRLNRERLVLEIVTITGKVHLFPIDDPANQRLLKYYNVPEESLQSSEDFELVAIQNARP